MEPAAIGKGMIVLGAVLALIGGIVWIAARAGLPFFFLPGDISVDRGNFLFRFPIVTCIILSIMLTVIVNVLLRFFGK